MTSWSSAAQHCVWAPPATRRHFGELVVDVRDRGDRVSPFRELLRTDSDEGRVGARVVALEDAREPAGAVREVLDPAGVEDDPVALGLLRQACEGLLGGCAVELELEAQPLEISVQLRDDVRCEEVGRELDRDGPDPRALGPVAAAVAVGVVAGSRHLGPCGGDVAAVTGGCVGVVVEPGGCPRGSPGRSGSRSARRVVRRGRRIAALSTTRFAARRTCTSSNGGWARFMAAKSSESCGTRSSRRRSSGSAWYRSTSAGGADASSTRSSSPASTARYAASASRLVDQLDPVGVRGAQRVARRGPRRVAHHGQGPARLVGLEHVRPGGDEERPVAVVVLLGRSRRDRCGRRQGEAVPEVAGRVGQVHDERVLVGRLEARDRVGLPRGERLGARDERCVVVGVAPDRVQPGSLRVGGVGR